MKRADDEAAGPTSVENAGPVVQHGDLEMTGALVAGRDLTIHGPVHVLADDGPPFGDLATRPGQASDVCPYPGLDAFDTRSAGYFHGRDADVDAVLALLRKASLVAVIGSSGSGKSSLLSAGVLPALAQGKIAGSERWRVAPIRPGSQPVEHLASALAEVTGAEPAEVAAVLRVDPLGFHAAVGGPVIWVVDQLEEVFDPAVDTGSRDVFLAAIASARSSTGSKIVLALRSDFYPHLDQEPALAAAVADTQHRVLPMGPQAIRDAIEKPALQVGLRVESELIEQMLADARAADNALPLLSYALEQTWRRRHNGWLTLAEYAKAGALEGAIDRAAERVWESLGDRHRATVRRVMLRLSHLGDNAIAVRRQARFVDLVTDADDETAVREVVDRLAEARILTADQDPATRAPVVDITHEAVLRAWTRLRTWLTEDREAKRAQDDLSSGAAAWARHGGDAGYLLRGARLAAVDVARRSGGLTVNDVERRFLALSRRLEYRQRWRSRLLGLLAAGLVAAVALTVVLVGQQRRISHEKTVADAVSLAAQSRSVSTQERDLGALLAVAGEQTDDNAVTRAAVQDVVSSRGGPLAYLLPGGRHATTVSSRFTRDGSVVVGTGDGAVCVLSPLDGRQTGPCFSGHLANITAVTTTADLVAAADATGLVTLHRQGAAPPVRSMMATSTVVGVALSPAHDQLLAATRFGTIERWPLTDRATALPALDNSFGVVALAVIDETGQVFAVTTDGAVKRWNLADGAELPDLAEPGTVTPGTTMRLEIVGGTRLVTVDATRIGIWDLRTGRPPTWTDTPGGTAMAVNPDGETVFVGTTTGTVTAWRLAPGPLAVDPVRYGLAPPVIALGAGEDFLVGADQNGRVISWDLGNRRSPAGTSRLEVSGPIEAVARSPEGAIASGGADGVVRVTREGTTTETHAFGVSVSHLAWEATGAIAVGTDQGAVYELDPVTGAVRVLLDRPATAVSGLTTSKGLLAAAFSDGQVLFPGGAGLTFSAVQAPVTALALSADGRTIAVASGDGVSAPPKISVAEGSDGFHDVHTLSGHTLPITSLAFSPDGQFLASGSDDTTIRVWSLADGSAGTTLRGHTDMVLALAYTADGTTLASGSQDGTLRLWDVDSGLQIGRPLQFGDGYVWSLAPSADGGTLTAANGTTVVDWPFSRQAWLDSACRLAQRTLTEEERIRYLPTGTAVRPCG